MSANDVERLHKTEGAAEILGVSPRTLEDWRWKGGGPPFIRLSRNCIRYRHSRIMEWAEQRTAVSTMKTGYDDDCD